MLSPANKLRRARGINFAELDNHRGREEGEGRSTNSARRILITGKTREVGVILEKLPTVMARATYV